MKGLIMKDLINLKGYAKQYAITLIFFIVLGFIIKSPYYLQALIVMYMCMMPMTTFSLDEQNKWDKYVLTMPVSRRDVVKAKYVLTLSIIAAGVLISLIFGLILITFSAESGAVMEGYQESGILAVVFAALALIMQDILMPLTFKFGSECSRMALLIIALIPVLLVFILAQFNLPVPKWLDSSNIIWVIGGGVMILALAGTLVSYKISCRAYDSKEF